MALLTAKKICGRPWAPQRRPGALSRELAGKKWASASREGGSPAFSPLQPRIRRRPTQPPHKGRAALPWDHSDELQYSVSVPERNTRGKLDKLLKKLKYQVAFYQRLLFYPGAVGEGSSENSSRSRPKTFQTSIQNYFELPRRVRGKKFWVPSTASYPANAASALSLNEGLFGLRDSLWVPVTRAEQRPITSCPLWGFKRQPLP